MVFRMCILFSGFFDSNIHDHTTMIFPSISIVAVPLDD